MIHLYRSRTKKLAVSLLLIACFSNGTTTAGLVAKHAVIEKEIQTGTQNQAYKFVIQNTGKSSIDLHSVSASCPCITSSAFAQEALSLPRSNTALFFQEVLVPARTQLQRSRALPMRVADDISPVRRGGAEQFQLLQPIDPKNFGPGVPLQ